MLSNFIICQPKIYVVLGTHWITTCIQVEFLQVFFFVFKELVKTQMHENLNCIVDDFLIFVNFRIIRCNLGSDI